MHPYRSPPDVVVLSMPHALTCFARLPQMANACDCEQSLRRAPSPMRPATPGPVLEPRPRAPSRASGVLALLTVAMFVLLFYVQDAHAPLRAVVVMVVLVPMVIAGNVLHLRDRP